jgi:chromosome segregation ATPase
MNNTKDSDFLNLFPDEGEAESLLADLDGLNGLELTVTPSGQEQTAAELEAVFSWDEFTEPELRKTEHPSEGRQRLVPILWRDYQNLRPQLEELNATLAAKNRQIEAQERRSLSADDLLAHQSQNINQNQEQLAQALAELQIYQQEAQRQQLQLETLAQQLDQATSQNHHLEQECKQLGWENQKRIQRIYELENQLKTQQESLQKYQVLSEQVSYQQPRPHSPAKDRPSFAIRPAHPHRPPIELPRFIPRSVHPS